MPTLPKLTIAAKLYAIFALIATATVTLAVITIYNARRNAELTDQFDMAFQSAQNVERINSLIYAVEMESRGVYMSPDVRTAAVYANGLLRPNDQILDLVLAWERNVQPEHQARFAEFALRIRQFHENRIELARRAVERGPEYGREWGDNDGNRGVRKALNEDIEALAALFAQQSRDIYAEINRGTDFTAWQTKLLGLLSILLALFGAVILRQAVVKPLKQITRVTEEVAEGRQVAIPYGARRDEVGALARSIAIFQHAMHHNKELNSTISQEANARQQRQEQIAAEIARFSQEVESSIVELGAMCQQMLAASAHLSGAADNAATRTSGAVAASAEASSNVRDIASAADELAASVMEIDRQVARSNSIAEKAVDEAERTNAAIQELDEAAKRIGHVVGLITDIAEQTNLLALNATIEAARAGEAGRGFAVVAGEVKALAGQTGKATEEIAAQIAGMQHATTRSIEALAAIQHTIGDISAISGAIAAAVTQQGAATQEIARSVEIAAKRTGDTADEVNRVGDATENTRSSVTSVRAVADNLGVTASRIRAQVEDFFQRLRAA